ncbi:sialic acid-binding Ig-like lectin 11 [Eptesicus fuscus]|uniref:sialic acid-binding Ig-like lectin 11 n=1 Tax=Eptesicus fuscus TaxID=29078 RepID=UPI0024046DF2|nr:sialic acid-binding Ig-like lectin 11 [Eptesicus fuscus]
MLLLLLLVLLPLLWAGSPQKGPEYQLQMQDSVTVQAGLCVHVPCKVSYPREGWNDSTPAYGYWYKKGDAVRGDVLVATNNNQTTKITRKGKSPSPFYLSGDPGAGNCSLSISGAGPRHSGKYYFHLERGRVNHTYKLLTVNVTALTQTPDIQVKKPLEAGRPGHLVCSLPGACAQLQPGTVSWIGAALRTRLLGSAASKSSNIVLMPRPQDHGTNLTCRVTFPKADVSSEKTITLNVSYAPQNLAISVSRGSHTELEHVGNGSALPVREGDSLRLLCVADSNPPATLSWAQGSRPLSPSQAREPGVLELPRVEAGHEGKFTCRAQHPRGSLRASLRLRVQNPPQLLGPSCSWEDQGLHCSCSSRAQPAPSLRWRLGAGLLEGNHGNASHAVTSSSAGPWTNSSLSLPAGLSPDLRLSCEARNVHGAQSASVLLLPGQGLLGAEATEKGVGKPALREAFVLGAVAGAGVVGLLSLCLIVFIVKTCRRDAPRAAAGEKDAPSTRGPGSLGYQRGCLPGQSGSEQIGRRPPPAASPAAAAPTPGEELELYYATLSFQGRRLGEPPDQEATSTEYAEIKIRT